MALNLCSDGHDEICYEDFTCPACKAISAAVVEKDNEIAKLEKQIEELEKEADEKDEQIKELEDELTEAHKK